MAEPAPLITIVDPRDPAPVHEAETPTTRPRPPWPVRALLVALVLLIGVQAAAASSLRAREQRQQRADRLSVRAEVDPSSPPRLSALDRMTVSVVFTSSEAADLLQIKASGGWTSTAQSVLPVERGLPMTLDFEHVIDCADRTPGPGSFQLALRAFGGDPRTVVVSPPVVPFTGQVEDAACGSLDAMASLRIVAAQVLRQASRSIVTLQLSNVSTFGLRVTQVALPGFRFRPAAPFPLRLQGRAPGLLVEEELPTTPLVLDAQVTSCTRARAALNAAVSSGQPDDLTFSGDGRGGAFRLVLPVVGVESYLEAEWRSTCG